MKVKESVFGSAPERLLFKALESGWPGRIALYHNLPILNVIDISGARVSQIEREFLKKTSLDYTACDAKTDRPLLSVEFDGLGHGYSQHQRYFELFGGPGGPDPYRREKLELKLKVAEDVGYPLFVVAYDEATPIAGTELTIAHGIIGKCLANMQFPELFEQRLRDEGIDRLPPQERQAMVDWVGVSTEVELDLSWNPLASEAARSMHEAQEAGVSGYSWTYLTDPPLQGLPSFQSAKRIGCRVDLRIKNTQEIVVGEAWVRNISGHGFSPFGILDEIAELMAARKFLASRN